MGECFKFCSWQYWYLTVTFNEKKSAPTRESKTMNLWRWTQCVYSVGEKHTKAKKEKPVETKVEVYSIGQCMDTQNNRWSLKTWKGRTPKWNTKMFSGRQITPNKVSKNTDLLQGISKNQAVVWIAERSQYQENRFVTPNSYIKKRI